MTLLTFKLSDHCKSTCVSVSVCVGVHVCVLSLSVILLLLYMVAIAAVMKLNNYIVNSMSRDVVYII